VIVSVDPTYFRPTEVESLLGDAGRARAMLGWTPEITLEQMVREMVAHDLEQARRHAVLKRNGYQVTVAKES
jgi:GDPmannose 4,6-dehydratase